MLKRFYVYGILLVSLLLVVSGATQCTQESPLGIKTVTNPDSSGGGGSSSGVTMQQVLDRINAADVFSLTYGPVPGAGSNCNLHCGEQGKVCINSEYEYFSMIHNQRIIEPVECGYDVYSDNTTVTLYCRCA